MKDPVKISPINSGISDSIPKIGTGPPFSSTDVTLSPSISTTHHTTTAYESGLYAVALSWYILPPFLRRIDRSSEPILPLVSFSVPSGFPPGYFVDFSEIDSASLTVKVLKSDFYSASILFWLWVLLV